MTLRGLALKDYEDFEPKDILDILAIMTDVESGSSDTGTKTSKEVITDPKMVVQMLKM